VSRGVIAPLFSLDHWWEVLSLHRRVGCEPDFIDQGADMRQIALPTIPREPEPFNSSDDRRFQCFLARRARNQTGPRSVPHLERPKGALRRRPATLLELIMATQQSPAQKRTVERVMHKFKHGELEPRAVPERSKFRRLPRQHNAVVRYGDRFQPCSRPCHFRSNALARARPV